MNSSYQSAKQTLKPSRPLIDMLAGGLINGSVLDYGCGKGKDIEYLASIKPNTLLSGYDPHFQPYLPLHKYDTVFCNYVINYIRESEDIQSLLTTVKNKLKSGGHLILTARTIGEVKGNVKRNTNWKQVAGGGYVSDESGIYQRGYDTKELNDLIVAADMELITQHFDIGPVSYAFVVGRKK